LIDHHRAAQRHRTALPPGQPGKDDGEAAADAVVEQVDDAPSGLVDDDIGAQRRKGVVEPAVEQPPRRLLQAQRENWVATPSLPRRLTRFGVRVCLDTRLARIADAPPVNGPRKRNKEVS
jgi:hypothetical protein